MFDLLNAFADLGDRVNQVTSNPVRPAWITAWEAHSLSVLTEGYFEMGIGTGRPGIAGQLRELGLPVTPVDQRSSQVRDVVAALRATPSYADTAAAPTAPLALDDLAVVLQCGHGHGSSPFSVRPAHRVGRWRNWQIVNLTTARASLLRSVTAGAWIAGGWCRVVEAGYPVSIKGVLVRDGRVVLIHNERNEWELPGSRIEPGETPEQTVARELTEESGLPVDVDEILDARVYHIAVPAKDVFVVTYGCTTTSSAAPVLSHEHSRIGEFLEDEVSELHMPEGYKRSIATWFDRLRARQAASSVPRPGRSARCAISNGEVRR